MNESGTFVVTDSLHIYAVISFAIHEISLVVFRSNNFDMRSLDDTDCTREICDFI